VTLFATADSVTDAHLVATAPRGYAEDPEVDAKVWEALHIAAAFERAGEFDVIHNSFDFLPLSYSRLVATPVVTTIHGFSSERIVPVFERYNDVGYYVAISDTDRHHGLQYAATIHHGIDMRQFELGTGDGGYLLFFGRIHPDKGTAEAIDVAARIGVPLVIAGIVQDRSYFERFIEPRVDDVLVRYVGPVGVEERGALLGGASALLHLVNFDEPFGFSVVEAMACGTPVVAGVAVRWARSSVTARAVFSSTRRMRRLRPCTPQVRSIVQPCGRPLKRGSGSSGWLTTTSLSTGTLSRRTPVRGSATRCASEPAQGRAVPRWRQLLAGAHRDGLVVTVRSG